MLAISQVGNHDIYEDTIYIDIFFLSIYLYIHMYSVYIYMYIHMCIYIHIHHTTIFQPQHHQCQAIYGTADRGAADQDDRTYRPVSLG